MRSRTTCDDAAYVHFWPHPFISALIFFFFFFFFLRKKNFCLGWGHTLLVKMAAANGIPARGGFSFDNVQRYVLVCLGGVGWGRRGKERAAPAYIFAGSAESLQNQAQVWLTRQLN